MLPGSDAVTRRQSTNARQQEAVIIAACPPYEWTTAGAFQYPLGYQSKHPCSTAKERTVNIAWRLRSLGLDRYQADFLANKVTADVLLDLTAEDLRELIGVGYWLQSPPFFARLGLRKV
jgi:hypothetical protein